ncbi:maltokinase N-terminal cap-like domain-containing protein [Rugosimonospora africana]|uniref:Maltokinase N-terminal cap domain-containing protein n=1 Tax=Rugosimonospora africana TaxID=556532 RepID=A0A8J3QZ03_9ACTN|nr:hypothetical protein [Rugosimonospora africana]GIH18824.1 hypothetical protein Raf01_69960 [Rugosimonospora africana]
MSVIHKTTLVPTKLELLTVWLPKQPWYLGTAGEPRLAKVGGFRLDDPEGEVGIEFMVAVDTSGPEPVTYHLPMTYRGAACAEAADGLIGTTEHGVLGHRFVYDGTHDPVLVRQLIALMQGETQAQAQSLTDTPDPTVRHAPVPGEPFTVGGCAVMDNDRAGTRVLAATTDARGGSAGVRLWVRRVLGDAGTPDGATPDGATPDGSTPDGDVPGHVVVTWQVPDGASTSAVAVTASRAGE